MIDLTIENRLMAALLTWPDQILPWVDDLEVADFFDLRNQVLLTAIRTLVARDVPLKSIDVIAILDEIERIDFDQDKHCADTVNGFFVADLLVKAPSYVNEKPVLGADGDYWFSDGERLEHSEMVRMHGRCDQFVREMQRDSTWESPRWWKHTGDEPRFVESRVRSDVQYLGSCRQARALGLDETQALNHIRGERGLKPLELKHDHKPVSIVRRPRRGGESRTRRERR